MLIRSIVYAALFLIVSLLGVAGLYILLSVEFLALVQVLIYGGAVMVLILFALMLTRDARTAGRSSTATRSHWPPSSRSRSLGAFVAAMYARPTGRATSAS